MLPASGFGGILQETLFIPANSRRFQTGLQRNRPEKYTEDGSSIPTGISSYRNRDHPSISTHRKQNGNAHILPDQQRNLTVSLRN
jgi:hypothetical protein